MGFEFLFWSGLLALPVAALPVLLHLLFRRKSPVVAFPTLRFIRVSIQQTAARKRVQRWLLLACRILLLLLLILAVSQPARKMLSSETESEAGVAAIVVDTSYSMQLKEGQVSLLEKANTAVTDLLRDPNLPLKDAKIAIFTSRPPDKDHPERLRDASQVLTSWAPFGPEPSLKPLSERVTEARAFLRAQYGQQKWLVVVSDFQRREFVRPEPEWPDGRIIVIDLHPDEQNVAGITQVGIAEQQPQPGIVSQAVVEVSGRAGGVPRPVTLSVAKVGAQSGAGDEPQTRPPQMASFDAGGVADVRFPVKLPAGGYLLLTGQLQSEENLPWAQSRATLIQMPPPRKVTLIESPGQAMAQRFIRLALESYEGNEASKPLEVQRAGAATGKEDVVVVPITQWPSQETARKLRDFARGGGTVIFSLEPGLEDLWGKLSAGQKQALGELLPAEPLAIHVTAGEYNPSVMATQDWLLAGLTDEQFQLKKIAVRRFVPFAQGDAHDVTTLLSISPAEPGADQAKPFGLLYRRIVGNGMVYTLSTLPDRQYTDLATRYTFLPLMVRMSLRPPRQNRLCNSEIGQALVLAGPAAEGLKQVYLEVPNSGERLIVASEEDGHHFQFDQPTEPGLYEWRTSASGPPIALANVQYPAAEAELAYRDANSIFVPAPGVLVARSEPEVAAALQRISQPQPRWSLPIALALLLLCLEAWMANWSKLGQPTVHAGAERIAAPGSAGA